MGEERWVWMGAKKVRPEVVVELRVFGETRVFQVPVLSSCLPGCSGWPVSLPELTGFGRDNGSHVSKTYDIIA